jgi:hypothetical protein
MKYLLFLLLFAVSCKDKCDHMGFIEDIQEIDSLLWDLKTDTNKLKRYLEDQRYVANYREVFELLNKHFHGKLQYSVSISSDSTKFVIMLPNRRPGEYEGEMISNPDNIIP